MLYAALIEEHLKEQKFILTNGKKSYTYYQLHEEVMFVLNYLYKVGAEKGDRVLIKSCNDVNTVVAVLACLAGGLIFVLLPETCSEEEIEHIIKDSSPSVIFDSNEVKKFKRNVNSKIRRVQISESAGAYIIYTSGSTGEKKGVFACHKQINFCCKSILYRLRYKESDKILCCLPIEFDYGLYQIFLSLFSKSHLFLVEMDMIQMIPRYLHQWEITIYPAIPSMVNLLLKLSFLHQDQLPYLRCITFTGEYLSVELIEELQQILPSVEVIPMYGTTECKRIAVMPEGCREKVMMGSCGLPLDGVKVYIEKENFMDTIGELVVEGPNVMEGYWNRGGGGFGFNPETGMKTYHTGDLMSIDEDGFLYFHGRSSGLIKVRGHRISELEIENIVQRVEGVLESAVVGIRDDIYGEKIGICIYSKDVKVKEAIQKALEGKPTYMNAYEIFLFFDALPKNQNGKVDKPRLRKIIYEKR